MNNKNNKFKVGDSIRCKTSGKIATIVYMLQIQPEYWRCQVQANDGSTNGQFQWMDACSLNFACNNGFIEFIPARNPSEEHDRAPLKCSCLLSDLMAAGCKCGGI